MSDFITAWLRQLDAICEQQQFETAEEAEAWLQKMGEGLSIEEFFDQHAPAHDQLMAILQLAEQADTPEAAMPLYQRAVIVGERFWAEKIRNATLEIAHDSAAAPAHPYLMALLGLAACQEWNMLIEEAADTYRKILHLDPLDHYTSRHLFFCLLITQGNLDEASSLLKAHPSHDSFFLFNQALLHFLVAADQAAIADAQGIACPDPMLDPEAVKSLERALRANRYFPHILTHPRAMQAAGADDPAAGSPYEALAIAHSSAHLWLGDWMALEWLLRHALRYPLSHAGHDDAWQSLLTSIGGDASEEERAAYLHALEEQSA